MSSGTNELQDLIGFVGTIRNPKLTLVVAFDYYDGPERGVALYASGRGVRFSSLGESKSRMFRAFKFTVVAGNWQNLLHEIIAANPVDKKIILISDTSPELVKLEQEVTDAAGQGDFVGVGRPNLETLELCAASPQQLQEIRGATSTNDSFNLTHRIIKAARKEM